MSIKMPNDFENMKEFAAHWTTSNLREQKALLELMVTLYYDTVKYSGDKSLEMLTILISSGLGSSQRNNSFFDNEANELQQQISHICSVFCVEIMNFEELMNSQYLNSNPQALSASPDLLLKVTELIWNNVKKMAFFGEPSPHGVVCMAWVR